MDVWGRKFCTVRTFASYFVIAAFAAPPLTLELVWAFAPPADFAESMVWLLMPAAALLCFDVALSTIFF